MEVPYQIHVYPNKKLRDYFFDFFMLFFAVTLGFIVENTREDIAKNKRGKREKIDDTIKS